MKKGKLIIYYINALSRSDSSLTIHRHVVKHNAKNQHITISQWNYYLSARIWLVKSKVWI